MTATLNPTAGLWVGLSTSGTSPTFELISGNVPGGQINVASVVTSVAGTSPSLQVFLDVADVSGTWYQVLAVTAQTAAGVQSAVGNPLSATPIATGLYRLRWTITGTNPVFNVAVTAFGS